MTTSLNLKSFTKLLLIPMGFIVLSLVVIAITPEQDHAILKLGILPLYITRETLTLCIKVFIRSLSSVALIFSLSLTVPMQHLIRWMKWLKTPDAFIELFVLSYRFIFILIEEAQDMLIAQEMRFGYFHLRNAIKTVNQLGASLFMRAFARFEDLNQAMALRFYDEG
jgi:cobalt/nickel transport system permease protein